MAKKSAESNTGLIIALVCFVLLSVTLGVFAYLGFAGQAELDKKAKEAAQKESDMKKERDNEQLRAAVQRFARTR